MPVYADSCLAPCVQIQEFGPNPLASTKNVSISGVHAGSTLIVDVRNGANSNLSSISNSSLSWTLVGSHLTLDWHHDLFCAVVPSSGTQNFTLNTNSGAVGLRAMVVEYAGIRCSGAIMQHGQGTGSTAASGNMTTSGSALIFSSFATDTDIDNQGSQARAVSGYTIQNPNCNTVPGVEPDQKQCVADNGMQPAGTYSANWTFGGDTWDVFVVAFPNAGSTTPPSASYFVSPAGNDSAAGSLSAPWKTIQKAASTLVAGDTVNIRAGTYNEAITMQNPGTASQRITYQNYNGEAVVIPMDVTISKNYITVSGLEIRGSLSLDGSYAQALNNYIHHGTAVFIHGSHNLLRGNRIMGHAWDQITSGWGNAPDHTVIENNDVSDPEALGEDFMQYMSHDVIVRGNTFHDLGGNDRHDDIYQSAGGEYNIWMIGNRFEKLTGVQYYMPGAGDHDHIWRQNVFTGEIGWGFNTAGMPGLRVVNNTFNVTSGYGVREIGKGLNNIFSPAGSDGHGGTTIDYNGVYPVPCCAERGTHDLWGVNPQYVSAINSDFHLQSNSTYINAGTFPTTTTSAGSGTQMPVQDAMLFVDGFGIADGDSIQLAGQTTVAKILSINYATGILTLDRALTWSSGQGVSTPYQGAAPDIGALEFASGSSASACDLNNDNSANVSDVQLCVNQAIGTAACSTGDINKDGACNVVDVQRVVNAALGGQCVTN
jgi:hypothetical protein